MFLAIETDDLYANIKNDEGFASIFDFQTYKEDHPMFPFYPIVPFDLPNEPKYHELVYKNKDVLGKFKDEAKGFNWRSMFLKSEDVHSRHKVINQSRKQRVFKDLQ